MVLGLVLGGLASGLVGAFSARSAQNSQQAYNSAMNKESYGYARKLNEQMQQINQENTLYQYHLERDSRRSAFQDTRYDLEKAGYNPLLALGQQSQGLNVGMNSGSANFNGADSSAVIDSLNSAVNSYNSTRLANSSIDSSKYQNDVNLAQSEYIRSQTRGQDINNVIQDRYGLQKAISEINQLKSQGILNNSQAKYYTKQLAVADSQIAVNSAEAQVLRSQRVLNQQQYDINAPTQRFAKSHPVAHGILSRVNPVSAIGGLAGLKYMLNNKKGVK